MSVEMVNPFVCRFPDDGSDPQGQVGGHQVHEAEAGEQAETLHDNLKWKGVF